MLSLHRLIVGLSAAVVLIALPGCADQKPAAPAKPAAGANTDATPAQEAGTAPTDDEKEPPVDASTSGEKEDMPAEEATPAEKPGAEEMPAEASENGESTSSTAEEKTSQTPTNEAAPANAAADSGEPTQTWNQWAGSPSRNNVAVAKNLPTEWEPGQFDSDTGAWQPESAKNVKWVARLGSQSYGNVVVADGKIFAGTNNGAAYLERYPASVDLGCLLCFSEDDGHFLWQHSSEKLPTGRVHDWPQQGICCAPLVEGKRLWFVTSRGEVACLDTEGFHDGKNDGPFKGEPNENKDEADVLWYLDMMKELKVSQHNMCSCSVTAVGDLLFVNTSNGVDEGHVNIPSPDAPSFLCLDKNTGKVLWQDNSPGENIVHGQWSSPAYAVIDGVPQVLFGGGDGWLRSFRGEATENGKAELLWEFDCNPKDAKYSVSGRSTRNHIIGTPVVYDNLVYIAVGEDPEHGEGNGHLWCVDPTKRGDVSAQLAVKVDDRKHVLPKRRLQAVVAEDGEVAIDNPNSAAVWHYTEYDWNGDGKIAEFEEKMHRTCGTVAIKDGLLFVPDFSGLFHCLDAKTGKANWTFDLFAATWGSALIVGDKVYVGDEEGKLSIFGLSADPAVAMKKDGDQYQPLYQIEMGNAVYSTPVVAKNVLYISNKSHLFAIVNQNEAEQANAADGDAKVAEK
ncbi:MAG TPA: PQQ-binding-like beta-propeller repeat protein [Pirellulales bacterium]|nr:PQQ-binding-like beta-propeller repeat protein [Pirellulales bacterium]